LLAELLQKLGTFWGRGGRAQRRMCGVIACAVYASM